MNLTTAPSSTSTLLEPLRESWVKALLETMLYSFGKKFTDQWGSLDPDAMRDHWGKKLAGFTAAEIARGVAALDTCSWPPSLPEFQKLCRPPIDPMVAHAEAVAGMLARAAGRTGTWSHPAIFWAALQIGQPLHDVAYSVLRPRWEKALADALATGSWQPIPEPAVALPAPGRTALSAEVARERLDEMQASDILKPMPRQAARDVGWAHKIMALEAKRDPRVSLAALHMAKQALGLE